VFESLLPQPHDTIVLDLLFTLCQWHELAKLRLHHDLTLQLLDETTAQLGSQFRKFQVETCQKVPTVELQTEADRRARQAISRIPSESVRSTAAVSTSAPAGSSTRQSKTFSMNTPKYHSLGHYAANIRRFGTVDSYSSEIVGLASYSLLKIELTDSCHARARPTILPSRHGTSGQVGVITLLKSQGLSAGKLGFVA
jgi:hypothetical protein